MLIFDEFAKAAVLAVADRAIEAHRVAADVEHPLGLLERDQPCSLRRFFRLSDDVRGPVEEVVAYVFDRVDTNAAA